MRRERLNPEQIDLSSRDRTAEPEGAVRRMPFGDDGITFGSETRPGGRWKRKREMAEGLVGGSVRKLIDVRVRSPEPRQEVDSVRFASIERARDGAASRGRRNFEQREISRRAGGCRGPCQLRHGSVEFEFVFAVKLDDVSEGLGRAEICGPTRRIAGPGGAAGQHGHAMFGQGARVG